MLSEVRRALDWLLDALPAARADRSAHAHLYRVPYALALAGERAAAADQLAWMRAEILTDDGDLRAGPARDAFADRWSSYPLAIIAQGAWHLERYDLAGAVLDRLAAFRDPATGGAYAARPERRATGRQDLFPTAQLGLTGLTVNDGELADGAFAWLRHLYASQPELPERLYTATVGATLITDVASDRFGLCTDFHQPRQAFYNPGIAAAFLARYALRTGSAGARELADSYLMLTVQGSPDQFDFRDSVQVCKFAWGAAALLDLAPTPRYRDYAERMVRWFAEAQHPDGHWSNSPFLLPDGPTLGSNVEVTAEFVQHLLFVSGALAGSARSLSSTLVG
jgi:hypothetical protein